VTEQPSSDHPSGEGDPPAVTLEHLTPVRKRLRVEVSARAVAAALDRAFDVAGRRVRLPGFRPGKAPRAVLERAVGPQVRHEVVGRLVEQSLRQALEAHGLTVVGTPDVDADGLAPGEPLRYAATIEVWPTITLGDLRGIEVVRPSATVRDENVDRMLEAMRESTAQLRPVEDRTLVEAGDVVTVDLTSRLEGAEPVRREAVLLEAGGGSFPLALERQLVGQRRGMRLSLRVPYPADYTNPGLAGRTVEFEVDLRDIRLKELPPLDDDFARDHGRCDSLAELRARVRTDLEREAASRAEEAVREAVLRHVLERSPFEVPPSLVERRAEALATSVEEQLPAGPDRERALAELRARLRPRAEWQVRTELLLDAVAARDGLVVGEDEVTVAVEAIAAREKQVADRVRALYARPEARDALRAKLLRERAAAGLVAAARVMPESSA
jgi:trigger factor